MILTLCTVFVLLFRSSLADAIWQYDEMWQAAVTNSVNKLRHKAAKEAKYRGKCVMVFWNANAAEEDSCKECLSGHASGDYTLAPVQQNVLLDYFFDSVSNSVLQYVNRSGVHCCKNIKSDLVDICCVWSQMELGDVPEVPTKECHFCKSGLCPHYYYNDNREIVANSYLCSAVKHLTEKVRNTEEKPFITLAKC